MTPKMQTDLIKSTRVFSDFEKCFVHFFDECERGFINELIINMYCRLYTPGKVVISYKSTVKEMYFVRRGVVQVFNPEHDVPVDLDDGVEKEREKAHRDAPILFLPNFSYFGDYQILYNLKSNLVFSTCEEEDLEDTPGHTSDDSNHIIFMCVQEAKLNNLCELFPQTA